MRTQIALFFTPSRLFIGLTKPTSGISSWMYIIYPKYKYKYHGMGNCDWGEIIFLENPTQLESNKVEVISLTNGI